MDTFIVLRGKHDPVYCRTAVRALQHQISEHYEYEEDLALLLRASQIVASGNEKAALRLLRERDNIEYEGFEVAHFLEDEDSR